MADTVATDRAMIGVYIRPQRRKTACRHNGNLARATWPSRQLLDARPTFPQGPASV